MIDYDGTLLDPQHQITPAVKQAMGGMAQRAYRGAGHRAALCRRAGLSAPVDDQGPGDFCITYNGALVLRAADGACVLQETLAFEDYCTLSKMAREFRRSLPGV